jgi:hypothetical protein
MINFPFELSGVNKTQKAKDDIGKEIENLKKSIVW